MEAPRKWVSGLHSTRLAESQASAQGVGRNARFARVLLGLGAVTFVGIGILYLSAPQLLNVYAGTPGPSQRTEIRAIYGGLELGVGLFCAWSLRARERLGAGLALLGLGLGGITLGRLVGWIVEGTIDPVNAGAGFAEGVGAALAWHARSRLRRPPTPSPTGDDGGGGRAFERRR